MTPSPHQNANETSGSLKSSLIGLVVSGLLTGASFYAASSLGAAAPFAITLAALAQLLAQLVFFLHLGKRKDGQVDLTIFLFTLVIIAILVGGTLWIMKNLEGLHSIPETPGTLYEGGIVAPENELK